MNFTEEQQKVIKDFYKVAKVYQELADDFRNAAKYAETMYDDDVDKEQQMQVAIQGHRLREKFWGKYSKHQEFAETKLRSWWKAFKLIKDERES